MAKPGRPKSPNPMVSKTITFSPRLLDELMELCQEQDVTLSFLVRTMLKASLARMSRARPAIEPGSPSTIEPGSPNPPILAEPVPGAMRSR